MESGLNNLKNLFWALPVEIRYYLYKNLKPKNFRERQALRKRDIKGEFASLKGFDDLKCIFVHIPKAGGVSINKALFGNLGGTHFSIKQYSLIFSPEEFKAYFKFTFVRNPWDRLVSAYTFLKSGGLHQVDRKWAEENISQFTNFEEFVLKWVNKENIYSFTHFIPQFEFITVNNKIAVDEIYRFENFNEDFNRLTKVLGVENKLKHLNKSKKRAKDYRVYYTDKTKVIIEKVYEEDIKILNYEF